MSMQIDGVNVPSVMLYDAPFSPNSSRAARDGSKINNSVAQRLYSANEIKVKMSPLASPKIAKGNMRYQFNSRDAAYNPSQIVTNKDVYEMETVKNVEEAAKVENYTMTVNINNHSDFRKLIRNRRQLADKVGMRMMSNANTTVQHKVFGTNLPVWYINKMIFLVMLEQELANEYGTEQDVNKDVLNNPTAVCDLIYEAYSSAPNFQKIIEENSVADIKKILEETHTI